MTNFPKRTVQSLLEDGSIVDLKDGNHGELHPTSNDYVADGIPFIMASDLNGNGLDLKNCKFISHEQASQLRKGFSITDDVLLTHKGTLGNVAIVPEVSPYIMLTPQVTYYRTNAEKLINRYLAYAFRDPLFQSQMKAVAREGTRPYIGITAQQDLVVPVPSLSIQKRIIELLQPYDDLIDNNNRRIALLEEAIHRLYREWFVHLRFPGHEHTPVVAGVPEGWEKRPVKDTFEITGGGTPRRKEERYWLDGTINWFTPSDLTKSRSMFSESSSEKISEAGFSNSSARMFPPYSIMMTSRATIGVISINTAEATTNQGFITCIPNERVPLYFLYCWLTANVTVFENYATGATFKEISKGVFKKIPVLLPSQSLLKDFHEIVEYTVK